MEGPSLRTVIRQVASWPRTSSLTRALSSTRLKVGTSGTVWSSSLSSGLGSAVSFGVTVTVLVIGPVADSSMRAVTVRVMVPPGARLSWSQTPVAGSNRPSEA